MRLIDRYILWKFLRTALFISVLLATMVCIIDFTEKSDNFLKYQPSDGQVIRYYMAQFPYVVSYATPITIFITTIFVTSRLAAHSEIVAIFSVGVGFFRFFRPYFIGTVLVALLSFYLVGWVVPDGNKYRIVFEINYVKPYYQQYDDRNVHFKVAEDVYLYLERYEPETETAYQVTLEHMVGSALAARLHASRMVWEADAGVWRLHDWRLRELLENKERLSSGKTKDTLLMLLPEDFVSIRGMHETLTIPELDTYIAKLVERGTSAQKVSTYEIEKYSRYMQPFAVLLLTFMGVMVSFRRARHGSGVLLSLGAILAFVYVIFFVLAKSMAQAGVLPPLLAVWVPNITFMGISTLMYYRIGP